MENPPQQSEGDTFEFEPAITQQQHVDVKEKEEEHPKYTMLFSDYDAIFDTPTTEEMDFIKSNRDFWHDVSENMGVLLEEKKMWIGCLARRDVVLAIAEAKDKIANIVRQDMRNCVLDDEQGSGWSYT